MMHESTLYKSMLPTPLGDCFVYTLGEHLVGLGFAGPYANGLAEHLTRHTGKPVQEAPAGSLAKEAVRQLEQYLRGERRSFELPTQLSGTAFQQRVWQQLLNIPYGSTATYGSLMAAVGTKSARAVGSAVGSNPLCILVPCHRVLAADGRVGQYSGGQGPATKAQLLALEGAAVKG